MCPRSPRSEVPWPQLGTQLAWDCHKPKNTSISCLLPCWILEIQNQIPIPFKWVSLSATFFLTHKKYIQTYWEILAVFEMAKKIKTQHHVYVLWGCLPKFPSNNCVTYNLTEDEIMLCFNFTEYSSLSSVILFIYRFQLYI